VLGVVGLAVGGYYAWRYVDDTRKRAERAADEIEEQLRELDPVTRAAVLARLGARARAVIPGR
jgi:hypothetical protein